MAYVSDGADDHRKSLKIDFLPLQLEGRDGEKLILKQADCNPESKEFQACMDLLNEAIDEGNSYPYFERLTSDQFAAYFFSHNAFCLMNSDQLVGAFYVKPNFPGRSSHLCNAGFLVRADHRGKGFGRLMGEQLPRIGGALGYEGSFFNLVYVTNVASVKLWDSLGHLGFKVTGRVPNAGKLKGYDELVDALQIYCSFK